MKRSQMAEKWSGEGQEERGLEMVRNSHDLKCSWKGQEMVKKHPGNGLKWSKMARKHQGNGLKWSKLVCNGVKRSKKGPVSPVIVIGKLASSEMHKLKSSQAEELANWQAGKLTSWQRQNDNMTWWHGRMVSHHWWDDNSCQKLPIVPRSQEKLVKVVKNCKQLAKVDKWWQN